MNLRVEDQLAPLSDRHLIWCKIFDLSGSRGAEALDPKRLNVGLGQATVMQDHVRVDFAAAIDDADISHQLRLSVADGPIANGIGMRLRLRGWKSVSYVAIGYTENGVYHHAKATHPLQNEWFDFDIGFDDIAWGWRNKWEHREERPIGDIRFYIKGVPGADAGCDLSCARIWREKPQTDAVFSKTSSIPEAVNELILDYQREHFPNHVHLARAFLSTGQCPLAGGVLLDWPAEAPFPPKLSETGTFQYSWHSQHPAVFLLLLSEHNSATERERFGALSAARSLIADWLTRSYDQADANIKYTWYDHGVAERLMAMIMLHSAGDRHGFDVRFMNRLRRAIHRHAQLLASEIFYACHQITRYHNHAWFQDLALMAAGLSFPSWPGAKFWVDTALRRIGDQFDKLIIRDGDFAVFAENSIGYHCGIGRLVKSIGQFADLNDHENNIQETAAEMERFAQLMRYPHGKRSASQGDTYRVANLPDGDISGREPWVDPQVKILPRAGYAVVQGNHDAKPFMLCFFATSVSSTHKHADNLSFTLYLDGIEWLIDPSFYSHEYTQPVPAYLRSAEAHNTLVIPGSDYAISPGHARLHGEVQEGRFTIEGSHDAVSGIIFTRRLEGSQSNLDIHICDEMNTRDMLECGAKLMLHCGEGVELLRIGGDLQLRHPASSITLGIILPEGCIIDTHFDVREAPIRGVTGLKFLQCAAINTIEITPPIGCNSLNWSIQAQ